MKETGPVVPPANFLETNERSGWKRRFAGRRSSRWRAGLRRRSCMRSIILRRPLPTWSTSSPKRQTIPNSCARMLRKLKSNSCASSTSPGKPSLIFGTPRGGRRKIWFPWWKLLCAIKRACWKRKQIHLRKELPDILVGSVYPGDLLQLVSNLVRNAAEALPAGGTLCVRLRASRATATRA